ncbi:MAG: hypothetical protein LBO71_04985 [Prevotellaceae bacterium]|jgi:hypothetical protein|nr:hypothetical protein [Prevotellaceae bacterium]
MQTYQIDAWVSENGTIALPNMPDLYNKEVQLVITPKEEKKGEEKKEKKDEKFQPASEFGKLCYSLRNCRPSEEEKNEESRVDELRYIYLKKKYDIDGGYISDEDVDNARYEYLMEKYK